MVKINPKTISIITTLFFGIAFLFFAIRPSIHISYFLVLIVLVFYSLINQKNFQPLTLDLKVIITALICYVLANFLPLLLNHGWQGSWKFQDPFLKLFLCVVILTLLFKNQIKIQEKIFFNCIFIGGILTSICAMYVSIVYQQSSIHLLNGIFQFAYFLSIISLLSLNLLLHKTSSRKIQLFAFITATLCTICLFANASRGIILGYLMGVFFTLLIHFAHQKLLPILIKVCLVFALSTFAVIITPSFHSFFVTKAERIQSETKSFDGKQQDTSIGLRFKIWDNAIAMFKLSPIFGMNPKTRIEKKDEIIAHTHFKIPTHEDELIGNGHNASVNVLAKSGIIGLLTLWFVYFSVANAFLSKLRTKDFIYPSCMLSILILYLTDSCFNTPLDSQVEAPLFYICIAVLLNLFYQKQNQKSFVFA